MSKKTLAGISAAAILAILTGNAWAEGEMPFCLHLDGNADNVGSVVTEGAIAVSGTPTMITEGSRFGAGAFKSNAGTYTIAPEGGIATAETGWTISFWVNPNGMAAWTDACGFQIGDMVYKLEKNGSNAFQMYSISTTEPRSANNSLATAISFNPNQWNHFALVVEPNGEEIKIYRDGSLNQTFVPSTGYLSGVESVPANLSKVMIGVAGLQNYQGLTWYGANGRTSSALVDEVAVYKFAANSAQIAWLGGNAPSEDILNVSGTVHSLSLNVDKTWAEITDGLTIEDGDIVEISSANKSLTFGDKKIEKDITIVLKSGLMRIADPTHVKVSDIKVQQGATLWIDCTGYGAGETVPAIADDIIVRGTIRPHEISTKAGGASVNVNEDEKVHFAQKITLDGGELNTDDGNVVFDGAISVVEGTTATYIPKWRKATIIKNLIVPATATFKMSPNLSSDDPGSLIKIANGTIDGRIELSGNNKAVKLQASDALAGKTLYLTDSGKIDLSGQTVGFEKIVVQGGSLNAPNEITNNNDVGTVEIAANAVVKDIHSGANKVYNYSGAGSTSSTLVVDGSQGWGMSEDSAISGLKLVVSTTQEFFIERAIGNDVALVLNQGSNIAVANVTHTFTTLSGNGEIHQSRWPGVAPAIQLTAPSTFEGTITSTPIKLANGSSLTLTNGGTINADPTAVDTTKRVNKVVTTEGEGDDAVMTTAYTLVQTYTVNLKQFAGTTCYAKIGDDGEEFVVSEAFKVDSGAKVVFRYVAKDGYEITSGGNDYQYSNISTNIDQNTGSINVVVAPKSYTITYTYTDGASEITEVTNTNPTSYTVESEDITIDTSLITKDGYTVQSVDTTTIATGSTGDKTITVTLVLAKTPAQLFVEAVGAAESGATVKVTEDITLKDKLEVSGKAITIDADSAVTITGQLRAVNGATLTIGSNVTVTSDKHPTLFVLGDETTKIPGTKKTTVIVNGTVKNTNTEFDATFCVSGNGNDTMGVDMTINGTVWNANGAAVYWPNPGALVINGTVEGYSAVIIKDGTLAVNDGATVKGTGSNYAALPKNGDGAKPTGDAIVAGYYPSTMGYGIPSITISGGTISVVADGAKGVEGYDHESTVAPNDAKSNISISGGKFIGTPDVAYIVAKENKTASWSEADADDYVTPVWTDIPQGPTSWDDVKDDTDVTDVVSEETAEALADSNVTAKDIAIWAAANKVEFTAGITIPVNALIFNCTIDDAPTAQTEAAAASAVLEEVIEAEELDLAALLAKAAEAGEGGLTITSLSEKYPMATIKLVESKKINSTETAKFFQLSIELK